MKKIFLVCIGFSLLALACNTKNFLRKDAVISVDGVTYDVQVADTPESRAQGLSGVDRISDGEGMLFVFSQPQILKFWMKGMNFPLDFVWINGDKIVDLTEQVPTQKNASESQLAIYQPHALADKVLEVNSGWVFRRGIKIGDTLTIVR